MQISKVSIYSLKKQMTDSGLLKSLFWNLMKVWVSYNWAILEGIKFRLHLRSLLE